jgi:UDP-N-acetyl-D-mannosaminuronate dehydrogenase
MDKQLYRPVVAVVGVGYVGTHLVEAFAKVYTVVAFDVSEQRVEQLARQYQGHPAVHSTSHAPDLADADAFLISVPTLLKEDKTIDTSFVEGAIRTISQYARDGVTVVVESSVAVGMTRKLLSPLIAANKVKVGMSPEVCCHTPFYRIQADIAARGSTRVGSFLRSRPSQRLFRASIPRRWRLSTSFIAQYSTTWFPYPPWRWQK